MFKKFIAGVAATALALGMVALTATPASATPEPKVLVCKYVGTPGVDEALKDGKNPISVGASALGHGWDGSTFPFPFADAHDHSVAIGFEGTTATCPAPQGPPPPPVVTYGVALYVYPKLNSGAPAAWENSGLQHLIIQDVDNTSAATNNYWTTFPVALPDYVCGPGWGVQQDKVSFTGSFNFPPEILYPTDNIGWPPIYDAQHSELSSYTNITVPPCTVKDAVASVVVSQPDCRVGGSPTFTLVNATWQSVPPTAPGSYTVTAVANPGHAFPGGATTLDVPYTIAGILDPLSASCYNPKPVKPGFDFITKCGTYGSINLVDTAYIDYQLVFGDGLQGWNHVVAVAISPYVLKAGATTDWWIPLGVYWNCPEASYEVGPCYDDDDESFKNLKVTFDNKSQFPQLYTIPALGIVEWVSANSVEVETIQIPTSGSTSYNVYAGLTKVLTIDPVEAFAGCVGVLLEGDPLHENQKCDDGELVDGSIWVERKEGLKYSIFNVTDLVNPVETLSGVGDGTTELAPGTYKVTLEALPGYVLDVQNPATSGPWFYTILEPEESCVIDIDLICEVDDNQLTLPEIPHVLWTVVVSSDPVPPLFEDVTTATFAVTAAAKTVTAESDNPDYAFADDEVTSWSIQLVEEGVDCGQLITKAPIPTNLVVTPAHCTDGKAVGATLTVGQILAGVDADNWFPQTNYYLDGSLTALASITTAISAGPHVVTAEAKDPDDNIKFGYQSSWEFTVLAAPASCDLTTLALTGAGGNPAGWAGIGYFLLVSGLALIAVRTVRRRSEVTQ